MNRLSQLILYKFCTLGGVEKCLLNRALLYKKTKFPVMIYVCFLIEERYSIKAFNQYIQAHHLENNIQIIALKEIRKRYFDFIFSIDTPEVFDWFERITVECHTGYSCNRRYLDSLPENVEKILAPSQPFANFLIENHPIDRENLVVFNNFIIKDEAAKPSRALWKKNIVFYYGRLDSIKNYIELIKIFEACKEISSHFLYYIMSPSINEMHHLLSLSTSLKKDLILTSDIPYTKIGSFLELMKLHNGIYVSASKMESFGLASAEALVNGIPAVLSNNLTHQYLVQNKPEFLYQLGNPNDAAQKIIHIANNYPSMQPTDQFLTNDLATKHLEKAKGIFGL